MHDLTAEVHNLEISLRRGTTCVTHAETCLDDDLRTDVVRRAAIVIELLDTAGEIRRGVTKVRAAMAETSSDQHKAAGVAADDLVEIEAVASNIEQQAVALSPKEVCP